jgi:tetratricopeptide (TPR) repeat protein
MLSRIISGRGDYDRAEKLLLELQDLFEHSLDYLVAIFIYGMLAGLYDRQVRYEEAEKSYRQALESAVKVDGEEHQNTQIYMSNLATVLLAREEAEEMKRRALEVWQRTLGVEHPTTLGGMVNLAALLEASGDLNACEELNYRAHRGLVRVLGIDHPDTLSSLLNLGGILMDQGKYNAAEKSLSQVLEARERLFGKNHSETLIVVNSILRLKRWRDVH